MKKVLLIGKSNDEFREISNWLSGKFQVELCEENEDVIKGAIQSQSPDLLVVVLSGSAVAGRQMFAFLLPEGLPILGIGSASNEAELFINGYLSEPRVSFLSRPTSQENVLKSAETLTGINNKQQGDGFGKGNEKNREDITILLVDDSPVFLRATEEVLSEKYKVIFAGSGAQAFGAIAKNKPDLILLDYEMPICDGKMVLEMMRAEDDMRNIPVVFLTGVSDFKHVKEVVELQPQGYLLKPCEDEILLSMVEKVLCESVGNYRV